MNPRSLKSVLVLLAQFLGPKKRININMLKKNIRGVHFVFQPQIAPGTLHALSWFQGPGPAAWFGIVFWFEFWPLTTFLTCFFKCPPMLPRDHQIARNSGKTLCSLATTIIIEGMESIKLPDAGIEQRLYPPFFYTDIWVMSESNLICLSQKRVFMTYPTLRQKCVDVLS